MGEIDVIEDIVALATSYNGARTQLNEAMANLKAHEAQLKAAQERERDARKRLESVQASIMAKIRSHG